MSLAELNKAQIHALSGLSTSIQKFGVLRVAPNGDHGVLVGHADGRVWSIDKDGMTKPISGKEDNGAAVPA